MYLVHQICETGIRNLWTFLVTPSIIILKTYCSTIKLLSYWKKRPVKMYLVHQICETGMQNVWTFLVTPSIIIEQKIKNCAVP
jgi:hypothetical protein